MCEHLELKIAFRAQNCRLTKNSSNLGNFLWSIFSFSTKNNIILSTVNSDFNFLVYESDQMYIIYLFYQFVNF